MSVSCSFEHLLTIFAKGSLKVSNIRTCTIKIYTWRAGFMGLECSFSN